MIRLRDKLDNLKPIEKSLDKIRYEDDIIHTSHRDTDLYNLYDSLLSASRIYEVGKQSRLPKSMTDEVYEVYEAIKRYEESGEVGKYGLWRTNLKDQMSMDKLLNALRAKSAEAYRLAREAWQKERTKQFYINSGLSITKAERKKLLRRYHPDNPNGTGDIKKFQEINELEVVA